MTVERTCQEHGMRCLQRKLQAMSGANPWERPRELQLLRPQSQCCPTHLEVTSQFIPYIGYEVQDLILTLVGFDLALVRFLPVSHFSFLKWKG